MAKVFAPFIIKRTMKSLTFYYRDGRNFVRKKSSLTRRKFLYAPCFKNTRHYAGLMAKASTIGSLVYNQLPTHWRQFWMCQAFTGEAMKMLKARKGEDEIQAFLYDRYVKEVIEKQTASTPIINTSPKRAYQKRDTFYWTRKTTKAKRRQANKQRALYNAGILGRSSKLASSIYQQLPLKRHKRCYYRALVALSMELLKADLCEADFLAELRSLFYKALPFEVEPLPKPLHDNAAGVINHPHGSHYFVTTLHKRFVAEFKQAFANQSVLSRNLNLQSIQ